MPPPERGRARLLRIQPGKRRGIATAETGQHGGLGQLAGLVRAVEVAGDGVGAMTVGRGGAATAASTATGHRRAVVRTSLTISVDVVCAHMNFSYRQIWKTLSGLTALLRVQHSAYKKVSNSCRASVLAVHRKKVPSRLTRTRPSFFSFYEMVGQVRAEISSSS